MNTVPKADYDAAIEVLRQCITEDGALGMQDGLGRQKRRLQAINAMVRGFLADARAKKTNDAIDGLKQAVGLTHVTMGKDGATITPVADGIDVFNQDVSALVKWIEGTFNEDERGSLAAEVVRYADTVRRHSVELNDIVMMLAATYCRIGFNYTSIARNEARKAAEGKAT